MRRYLHCYAEGRENQWEAICLDLDIAVQGESLAEVVADLFDAVKLHLEHVATLPDAERSRFERRAAPISLRLRFLWLALRSLLSRDGPDKGFAEFVMPRAA
jgi:hypothetical protein